MLREYYVAGTISGLIFYYEGRGQLIAREIEGRERYQSVHALIRQYQTHCNIIFLLIYDLYNFQDKMIKTYTKFYS